MFTVALLTDDGQPLDLLTTDDDISDIVAEVADQTAVIADGVRLSAFRSRIAADCAVVGIDTTALETASLTGAYTQVAVNNAVSSETFDLHSCGIGHDGSTAGEIITELHRQGWVTGEFKGSADVPRAPDGKWCKGAQCQGGVGGAPTAEPLRKVHVSGGQAAAARDDIADKIAVAGDDLDARAGVLAGLDSEGAAATISLHDRLQGDQWTPERQEMHRQIVDDWFAQHADIPHDRQALIVGGLPGAGKSTAMARDDLGLQPERYAHLDPDGIKQELLDRNAITRVKGMTDGEHAALLHEESSYLADVIRVRAEKRGLNIIVDKTMGNPPVKDIGELRDSGYSLRGVYVHLPVDESKFSADQRWQRGGRFIPPSFIESSRLPGGQVKNMESFRQVAPLFDDWTFVDNTGLGTPSGSPRGAVRQGAGDFEFAQRGMTVFRTGEFKFFGGDVPRDDHGRWTAPGATGRWFPGYDPIPEVPAHPASAAEQADLVLEGRSVRISPKDAPALLEELGNRSESTDLTKVSIDGHPNLFGAVADNQLRRVDMPQIPEEHLDGFGDYLSQRGVSTRVRRRDPADLKATQNELDGRKVGGMLLNMRTGAFNTGDKPMWTSSDDYILDGHHRWAAEAALSVSGTPRTVITVQASVPMSQLIQHARTFNTTEGIEARRYGMKVSDRVAVFAAADQVPRDWHGRWTRRGGAGGSFEQVVDEALPRDRAAAAADLEIKELAEAMRRRDAAVGVVIDPNKYGGSIDAAIAAQEESIVSAIGMGLPVILSEDKRKLFRPQFAIGTVPRDTYGRWCAGAQCSGAGMPGSAEFDQMEKVGGPLGSNGGQWYRDDDGQKYLVKPARSREHAENELAAGLTYEHLGVPVNGTGMFERDGTWYVSKRAVEGDIVGEGITPDMQMQARHGFHADTLTSSWDTFGLSGDNTLMGSDGTIYRIDVGGSNMFRAMGGDKESFNPGRDWTEPWTMRSGRQGTKLYGNMSDTEAAAQLSKLQGFDFAALDRQFAAAGISPAVRQRTIATYRDRVENQLPGILRRLTGQQALRVSRVTFGRFDYV